MIIERFYTPGLAQVAYAIADPETKTAAIIDPRRDVDEYLAWARDHGLTIVAVLETHVHADFVSGARELANATGAKVYAARLGETEFPHEPLEDGTIIPVGQLSLRGFWTPGHTPEHMSYLLYGPGGGDEPVALFSGDTLFAGEIGRPDLLGPAQTKSLVEHLYDTVTNRLAALPDHLIVFPGHGAGSPCGKNIGESAQTTIGQEKRFNYAFQTGSLEEFERAVMSGMPTPPAYYPTLKRTNKAGPELVKNLAPGEPLSAEEVARRQENSALLLDTRSPADFAGGHIPGSISVGLGASFPIWVGWLAPYDREVVLILPADERYPDVQTELRRIGVDNVAGFLAGGIAAWEASGRPVERLAEMSVEELAKRVGSADDKTIVLDVRDPSEWAAGHIPGAENVSAGSIATGITPEFADSRTVAVICGSGYRSSVAASLLQSRGIDNVVAVPGGMSTWSDAGLLTESGGPGEEAKTMYNRLVGPWQAQGAPSATEVTVSDLQDELAKGPIQIVDVREPEEWATGHIPGSIHIPMGDVSARVTELNPELPVVTVCRIGVRSLLSADELLLSGFGDVRSLAGGIVAWEEAGQPLEH